MVSSPTTVNANKNTKNNHHHHHHQPHWNLKLLVIVIGSCTCMISWGLIVRHLHLSQKLQAQLEQLSAATAVTDRDRDYDYNRDQQHHHQQQQQQQQLEKVSPAWAKLKHTIVRQPALSTFARTPSSSSSSIRDLTILPHELPGYTGWARPVHTLAGDFERIQQPSQQQPSQQQHQHQHQQDEMLVVSVGQNCTVRVHCSHEAARYGGSSFFVRAYGRSLLPGIVQDYKNGTYDITVIPFDEGTYTLEVVLTFSLTPNYMDTPLKGRGGEPSYEGYMLPGFPIAFTVTKDDDFQDEHSTGNNNVIDATTKTETTTATTTTNTNNNNNNNNNNNHNNKLPVCQAHELIETSTHSQLYTGRWLVTNKTRHWPASRTMDSHSKQNPYAQYEAIDLQNYKASHNALGFQMEYFYNDCTVLSYADMTSREKWLQVLDGTADGGNEQKKHQAIHVLYIGDSNTRNQFNYFRDHIGMVVSNNQNVQNYDRGHSWTFLDGRLKLTYVDMMGNWPQTFNKTVDTIHHHVQEPRNRGDNFMVLYNAGLHEITNRCSLTGEAKGLKYDGSCYDVYRQDVRDLTKVVKSFPASLRIWQSTVAGWPKWGLFGVSWPQTRGQKFPLEPNFCGWINELAWDVVHTEHQIPVMDTYWISSSRPDHREVADKKDANQQTMYKLVHLGDEVYSFLVRKFVHAIFEARTHGRTGVPYL